MSETFREDMLQHLRKENKDFFNMIFDSDTTINVVAKGDSVMISFLKQNCQTLINLEVSYEVFVRLHKEIQKVIET